jgi:hypothetical protein
MGCGAVDKKARVWIMWIWVVEHWISKQVVNYVDVGCGALDKQARAWILWMWVLGQSIFWVN